MIFYSLSFLCEASHNKDSSALLLLMIEKDLPIDCVLYADTGMEFPEMEAHITKLDDFLYQDRGIHITTLRHPHGFEWLMFEEPKQKPSCLERRARLGVPPYGNGWPGIILITYKALYGNRRNMSVEEEASLLEPFRKKAEKGQIVEVSEIKASYEQAVGHRIGGSQIYYVLGRHGWRKVMPRSKHPKKASEEVIETSKKLKKK